MKKLKQYFKTKNPRKILLFTVILLAFFLRIYKIAEYPVGLNADEAAIGYNAYSLTVTGKDEFGHPWPINFQSFNDYKPGLYFYLVLPFVKFLGLNELAVRLPSVILGTLTVFFLYFLVKEIFKELPSSEDLGLVASLFLAVSPWHLHFSRGGWESNASVFFIVAGCFFFFKFFSSKKSIIFSSIFFILAMFCYHSARLVVPLLIFGLLIINFKKIFTKANRGVLLLTGVLSFSLLIVLLISMTGQAGLSRFSGVGLFADEGPFWRTNELRGQHLNPFSTASKILHNKYLEYGIQFFDNYLRHFSGDFLFISGDEIQRNRVMEMGQFYWIDLMFLLAGVYFLFKTKPKNYLFILYWLTIAPVASALTFQSPHAIRALNMVIPLEIIAAYGFLNIWKSKIVNRGFVLLFHCFIVLALVWNFSFYLHQYYIHTPQTYPAAWEYGFRELVDYVKSNEGKYDKIYVTNKYDQPYILFAFYLKYSPEEFQKEAKLTARDQYGFSTVESFGKYHFSSIDSGNLPRGGKTLIVGAPNEIPDSATIVKRIYFKDGKNEAFRIIEN